MQAICWICTQGVSMPAGQQAACRGSCGGDGQAGARLRARALAHADDAVLLGVEHLPDLAHGLRVRHRWWGSGRCSRGARTGRASRCGGRLCWAGTRAPKRLPLQHMDFKFSHFDCLRHRKHIRPSYGTSLLISLALGAIVQGCKKAPWHVAQLTHACR